MMSNLFKRLWFRYYLWVVIISFAAMAIYIYQINIKLKEISNIIVGVIGVGLSVIYFVQKQKLEEIRLFKELFIEFNKRYDNLNGTIFDLKNSEKEFGNDEVKILDDYFNLCAEEYLFFKKGRILPEVWGAWCRGMLIHLGSENIEMYWDEAQKENSFYGLTTQAIKNGARYKT